MLAGFIWLAFSSQSSSDGYGSYNRKIYYDGISDWLFSGNNLFGYDGDYKRHKRSSNLEYKDQGIVFTLSIYNVIGGKQLYSQYLKI